MYGYGPYTGCAPAMPMTGAAPYSPGYALAPWNYGGFPVIGADAPAAQPTLMDKLKIEGDKETFGIKRKFIAGGAVAIAGILILSAKGVI